MFLTLTLAGSLTRPPHRPSDLVPGRQARVRWGVMERKTAAGERRVATSWGTKAEGESQSGPMAKKVHFLVHRAAGKSKPEQLLAIRAESGATWTLVPEWVKGHPLGIFCLD